MKKTRTILIICFVIFTILVGIYIFKNNILLRSNSESTTTASVQFVSSTITADGTVMAQDQARLNFQTAGKLVYLPVNVGDKVNAGQVIAALDTTTLKEELQLVSNAYQTTKNNTDQAMENNQAGVLEGQQRYLLDVYNKQGYAAITEATVVYDTVTRIVDNDVLAKNSAQISVDLANYALTLASLTSPIHGIITHEDVTVTGINITPATTFTVADPDTMVFRANVPTENIYYITEGSVVTIAVDGIQRKMSGTVVKIYPSKVVLPTGEAVYQVDIASDELKKQAKLDETGRAIISTNSEHVALVPVWTVLAGTYIWIDKNGVPQLKRITAGKIHGNEIEITSGLAPTDNIIIDPKYIPSRMYPLL